MIKHITKIKMRTQKPHFVITRINDNRTIWHLTAIIAAASILLLFITAFNVAGAATNPPQPPVVPNFSGLKVAGDAEIGGNVKMANGATITGKTTLNGDLSVNQNATIAGNTTLNGDLNVNAPNNVNLMSKGNGEYLLKLAKQIIDARGLYYRAIVNVNGDLSVNQNATIAGNTTLNGDLNVNAPNNVNLMLRKDGKYVLELEKRNIILPLPIKTAYDVSVNGNLFVDNNATIRGDTSVNGDLFPRGNIYLGTETGFDPNPNTLSISKYGDIDLAGVIKNSRTNNIGNVTIDDDVVITGNATLDGKLKRDDGSDYLEPIEVTTEFSLQNGKSQSIPAVCDTSKGYYPVSCSADTAGATMYKLWNDKTNGYCDLGALNKLGNTVTIKVKAYCMKH